MGFTYVLAHVERSDEASFCHKFLYKCDWLFCICFIWKVTKFTILLETLYMFWPGKIFANNWWRSYTKLRQNQVWWLNWCAMTAGLFCVTHVGIKVQNKKEDISREKSGCIKVRIHLKNDFNQLWKCSCCLVLFLSTECTAAHTLHSCNNLKYYC